MSTFSALSNSPENFKKKGKDIWWNPFFIKPQCLLRRHGFNSKPNFKFKSYSQLLFFWRTFHLLDRSKLRFKLQNLDSKLIGSTETHTVESVFWEAGMSELSKLILDFFIKNTIPLLSLLFFSPLTSGFSEH